MFHTPQKIIVFHLTCRWSLTFFVMLKIKIETISMISEALSQNIHSKLQRITQSNNNADRVYKEHYKNDSYFFSLFASDCKKLLPILSSPKCNMLRITKAKNPTATTAAPLFCRDVSVPLTSLLICRERAESPSSRPRCLHVSFDGCCLLYLLWPGCGRHQACWILGLSKNASGFGAGCKINEKINILWKSESTISNFAYCL